ncbi:IS3 family transposase [uncultured Clostridium sp.]
MYIIGNFCQIRLQKNLKGLTSIQYRNQTLWA